MESMLYLEYLDKINNRKNLNIFNENKDKGNNEINKEEKNQESMMYLEYLDKLNNSNNLNIYDKNKKLQNKDMEEEK